MGIPIFMYSAWTIQGTKSLQTMSNCKHSHRNLLNVMMNPMYLGIICAHSLQAFGCSILQRIALNKLSQFTIFDLDGEEFWDLLVFILALIGIVSGGVLFDHFQTKSVTKKHKRKKRKKRKHFDIKTHRKSSTGIADEQSDGDNANLHSLVNVRTTSMD